MPAFAWSQPNCEHCAQPKPTDPVPAAILDSSKLPADRMLDAEVLAHGAERDYTHNKFFPI